MEDGLFVKNKLQYIANMRPVIQKKALFSDMSPEFVIPFEPRAYDKVRIRFRAARDNVDMVFLCMNKESFMMDRTDSDELFDYFQYSYQLENEPVSYYFDVQVGKLHTYFNMRGAYRELQEYYNFKIFPGFFTPDWAKGAVIYQIYVDRFYNGDKTNDVLDKEYFYLGDYVSQVKDWDKYPAQMGVREFYGGDLQGVMDKMDYLQNLGIDVIYFNPLFVSPSNHRYDIQDYDYIDPHIGKIVEECGELLTDTTENRFATRYINRVTNRKNLEAGNQLFAQLVKEAHKRGIRIILDGVFNHCGSFNKWMDRERIYENAEGYEKGAYVSADSPYRDFFLFFRQEGWPYNGSYDGWWGHDTMPKLNYEQSQKLCDYIIKVGKKWVSAPYNADGWRLDVAADLGHSPAFNHEFWKRFRLAVKDANPDAVVLAEHYGNPSDWLKGDEWDTVMNYDAFMEPVTWFFTGMQKHSDDYREDLYGNADAFWGAIGYHASDFSGPSLYTAMNELSNHDHSRFLTRTNHKVGRVSTLGSEAANTGINKAVLQEAVVLQMTWPGAPTIYYGDEAGVCGFTDPDNRRTYPWGHEDTELIEFHREIIRIHKENHEFIDGALKRMEGDYQFLAYGRFKGSEQSVVVINNSDHELIREISVWEIGIPKQAVMNVLLETGPTGYSSASQEIAVIGGKILLQLPPYTAMIIKHKNDPIKQISEDFVPGRITSTTRREQSDFTVPQFRFLKD